MELFSDEDTWQRIISKLFENEQLASELLNNPIETFNKLSSGQKIISLIITDIISNIKIDSLLVFDEPENHLHPNMVSLLMIALKELLEIYDSYAIIATHSPVILQEIPSEYVQVLSRYENIPVVRKLNIECFGENLTAITEDVFEVSSLKKNWKKTLEELWKAKRDFKNIVSLFPKGAPYNVMLYLKSLENE